MKALLGRVELLERKAPSLRRRPAGMTGDVFIEHVFRDLAALNCPEGQLSKEWRVALSEWLDILTVPEMQRMQSRVEAVQQDRQMVKTAGH